MSLTYSKVLSKTFFINFLFSFIPISFIAGNLLLNTNILLILLSSIIFYKQAVFKEKFSTIDKLVIIFFIYILCIGFYSSLVSYFTNNFDKDFTIVIKTLLYLRFLLLYFVLKYLIKNNIINFKVFFTTSALCSIFVCLDIFYQFVFGKDIFGYKAIPRRLSGPFGDELIAGGYLQRFSIFAFFFPLFFKFNNRKIISIIFSILFCIIFLSLIFAGNRIPLVLFLIMLVLIFLFEKKTRKYFLVFIVVSSSIFLTTYNFNNDIKNHFSYFKKHITKTIFPFTAENAISTEVAKNFTENAQFSYIVIFDGKSYRIKSSHLKDLLSGYRTWKLNKYIGDGIKSFQFNCPKVFPNCSTHPHNYYLEILSNLGIIGLLIFSSIILIILYNSLFIKYFRKSHLNDNHIITPFIFLFLVELFPLKTTGSFFSTQNATFILFLLSVIIALTQKKKLN